MTCGGDCGIVDVFKGIVESFEMLEDKFENGIMNITIYPKDSEEVLKFKGKVGDVIVFVEDKFFVENRPMVYASEKFWRFSADNVKLKLTQYESTQRYSITIWM